MILIRLSAGTGSPDGISRPESRLEIPTNVISMCDNVDVTAQGARAQGNRAKPLSDHGGSPQC